MSEKETSTGGNGQFDQELYDWLLSCEQAGDFSEWNSWVEEIVEERQRKIALGEIHGIPEINLRGADLAKRNLKGIKLLFANLEGVNLSRANLERANLREAHLEGAILSGAKFEGAFLDGANLEGAFLYGADLRRANLEEANLRKAHLYIGEEAELVEADLGIGADLFYIGVNLRKANLEGADLEGADLRFAKLEGADLSRANLERANLEWAHLRKANLFMGANLREANLEGADLRDTFLLGANLREANLEGAKLEGADLTAANLTAANLERAIIRFAILLGTKCCLASVDGGTLITGCMINDKTDFTGVGLSGTRVDPKLHTRLLRNIRKMQWEEWYAEKKILTFFRQHGFIKWMDNVSKEPAPSQNQPNAAESASIKQKIKAEFATIAKRIVAWAKAIAGCIVQIPDFFINLLVKLFWWISDYGSKTWRIIIAFLLLNGFFTLIYSFIHLLPVTNLQEYTTGLSGWLMSFLQTTLIPFSIMDIRLEDISLKITALMTLHVIFGYVILAALVTRLAIMFQDTGP